MIDKAKMIAEIIELTTIPSIDAEHDLTANELAPYLKVDSTNVARKMAPLVASGQYATAIKQHPVTKRNHRVWWKIEGPEMSIDAEKDR